MRDTSARTRFAATGAPALTLAFSTAQEVFGRDLGRGSVLPLRQQVRVELSLIFGPAPLVRLGVVLDVPLGELAEREHVAGGALLGDGISALGHGALRLARQLARVGQRHGRVATQRQALLAAVLVAEKHRPGADVVAGDAEAQAGREVVEVIDAAGRRRRQGFQRRGVQNPTLAIPATPPAEGKGAALDTGTSMHHGFVTMMLPWRPRKCQKLVGMTGFEPATP